MHFMRLLDKKVVLICCLIASLAIYVASVWMDWYSCNYPYGFRVGKLSTFMGVLLEYAENHEGWYPDGASPYEALTKLYPQFAERGEPLAGLSGSEQETARLLKEGRQLNGKASSWIYFPGFRKDDNPEIVIIYERAEGIFITGSRADGHAVGFAEGLWGQIPSKEWLAFLKKQELMRQEVLAKRRY
jgi:hypothetical protein